MTVSEFRQEFNLLYDNIASKNAPGLDDYEISVFLTYAQEELIKGKDNPKSNRLNEGFEDSEKRRIDLKELIRDYKTTFEVPSTNGINVNSKFYRIPNDVLQIKHESVLADVDGCKDFIILDVVPKTLDEYNVQIKNPFKRPNEETAWRLDYNSTEPGHDVVELISNQNITQYRMRYLKRARPIILTDLDAGDYLDSGLTILGETQQQTSELDPSVHSEIVRVAVELATASYKEDSLGNIVELYKRKE